ncbi:hypothetical protein BCR32DRAFT_239772 [Anaeromyces robustus]|uniref:Uncharacterized protein n=1 Tax=Anaeromyces robustus TaxID=1754192 RepID=A0A1Y1XQC7_9FUNG|nr:hypothetical protein BCR32DRAFT_239772 [Anaeromyces robustus]|eukprot:ORX87865.1 hypothetical protein BCR32DRAFT_239772 [Anaeromyces robustus]
MENKDNSIPDFLMDNEDGNDFRVNPFQRDVLLERSKSKTKNKFNKLFNTAQLKINQKLTLNDPKSQINKFEYIDKDKKGEEKSEIEISNNTNNVSNKAISSNEADESMTEYKDASEHYSIIIPDDSEIIENNNNNKTESNEPLSEPSSNITKTNNNILDSMIYTNINNKKLSADEMFQKNVMDSRRLETIVNSLGNMNENVKKRIISHISNNSGLIESTNSNSSYGNYDI